MLNICYYERTQSFVGDANAVRIEKTTNSKKKW